MGRYYSGDINGKFAFAVQDSDAADRFGMTGSQPAYLCYYYEEENFEVGELEEIINNVNKGIKFIIDKTEHKEITFIREDKKEKVNLENLIIKDWKDYSSFDDLEATVWDIEDILTSFEEKERWHKIEIAEPIKAMIQEYISKEKLIHEFYDLILGAKIYYCIKEQGSCEFEAEF